eukprot:636888-Prorocentrum_minimum.AAC.4
MPSQDETAFRARHSCCRASGLPTVCSRQRRSLRTHATSPTPSWAFASLFCTAESSPGWPRVDSASRAALSGSPGPIAARPPTGASVTWFIGWTYKRWN